jgi:DNA gyrase subunit A
MRCINESDEIVVMTVGGVVLRTSLNEIRETGRSTQGVTLIKVAEGDEIVGIAVMKEQASVASNGDESASDAQVN